MFKDQLLAGRYKLIKPIGIGGMSEVWLSEDKRLDRNVAVKLLKPDLSEDRNAFKRFQKEAFNAASLNHPNIVAVFDSGEALIENINVPYIVMEYVTGHTLREYIKNEDEITLEPISIEQKLYWIADASLALEYSHQHRIIHRDIKPANIMINNQGIVKVMDFGISRALTDNSNTMTQTSAVVGTIQYLSPEQARGEPADEKSDIYSLGCVLFELLTKKPPFTGDSAVAVAYQHVREDAVAPSTINSDISPELNAVVLKSLNKNPINRYQSSAEMYDDLIRVIEGKNPQAPKILLNNITNPVTDSVENLNKHSGEPTVIYKPKSSFSSNISNSLKTNLKNNKKIGIILSSILVLTLVFITGNKILPSLFSKKDKLVVENVARFPRDKANEILVNQGFKVIVKVIPDNDIPAGIAINTDPSAGSSVSLSTVVTLNISSGPTKLVVPNLIGQSKEQVLKKLKELGFQVDSNYDERASIPRLKGKLVATEPKLGRTTNSNEPIRLIFGKGIDTDKVPDYTKENADDAKTSLEDLGFKVEITDQSSTKPEGSILSMIPSPGANVPNDGIIKIVKSKGDMFVMPFVADASFTEKQAKDRLSKAGFTGKVTVRRERVSIFDIAEVNRIIDQNIEAGESVSKNSEIILTLATL